MRLTMAAVATTESQNETLATIDGWTSAIPADVNASSVIASGRRPDRAAARMRLAMIAARTAGGSKPTQSAYNQTVKAIVIRSGNDLCNRRAGTITVQIV
jgi:hypothetical protein